MRFNPAYYPLMLADPSMDALAISARLVKGAFPAKFHLVSDH